VVPEKQGLKPPEVPYALLQEDGISGGSRKTRIETGKNRRPGKANPGISGGSRKTRIETYGHFPSPLSQPKV